MHASGCDKRPKYLPETDGKVHGRHELEGVETDPEKIAVLKTWPVPQHLKELKAFLGVCGYYRNI